jgi:hypothetical protein
VPSASGNLLRSYLYGELCGKSPAPWHANEFPTFTAGFVGSIKTVLVEALKGIGSSHHVPRALSRCRISDLTSGAVRAV